VLWLFFCLRFILFNTPRDVYFVIINHRYLKSTQFELTFYVLRCFQSIECWVTNDKRWYFCEQLFISELYIFSYLVRYLFVDLYLRLLFETVTFFSYFRYLIYTDHYNILTNYFCNNSGAATVFVSTSCARPYISSAERTTF